MEQLVEDWTRYRNGSNPSLLDLIITNQPSMIDNIEIGEPFGKSDHSRIMFETSNAHAQAEENASVVYNFRKLDNEKFENFLNVADWDDILDEGKTLDNVYKDVTEKMKEIIDQCTPKYPKRKENIAPWSTALIKKLAIKKRMAWDRFKYTMLDDDYNRYKEKLKEFCEAKDISIRKYEYDIIANKNVNRKQYYRYVNKNDKYLNRKICLEKHGAVIEDTVECAEELNRFFASVFTKGVSEECNDNSIPDFPAINELTVDVVDVRKKILELILNKSTEPD